VPRFDLLHVDRYHAMTIQFARGCPFQCEFCDIIVMYGRRPRAKRVDQVLAEIEECHRLGAKQVFVVDDNFIGNKKLAKDLLRAMARWGRERGYPMDFNTEVSLNAAQDDELLALLRDANFTTVFVGIESPRVESLQETKKTQNTRGDLVESGAAHPVVRDPGAGGHDRRLRRRRRDDLRRAAPLHPGRAHPRLDDRHAPGDAQDPAPRARRARRPAPGRLDGSVRLSGAAERLASALRAARSEALARGRAVEVRFDPPRSAWSVREDGGPLMAVHQLPAGVTFSSVPGTLRLRFTSVGTADNGTVVLAAGGRARRVVVNQRGRVRVQ
jgi:hypothetical protein